MAIPFYLAAAVAAILALLAILARTPGRAAILLGAFSTLLAVQLIAIGAPFLALAQLFLQVGPIVAIARQRGDAYPEGDGGRDVRPSRTASRRPRPRTAAAAGASALAAFLLAATALSSRAVEEAASGDPGGADLSAPPSSRAAAEAGGARSIGESLVASSLPALEAAGVLILVSTVAASTVARRGRGAPEARP